MSHYAVRERIILRFVRAFAVTLLILASPPSRAQELPLGDRIASGEANVRASPDPMASVIGKLKPGVRFNVDAISPDGKWHRITVVPVVTGWVATPVLQKISADADPGAEGRAVPLQQVLLLVTGLSGPLYESRIVSHAGPGRPFQVLTRTYDYRRLDDCRLALTTQYVEVTTPTPNVPPTENRFGGTDIFDFTKLTAVHVSYTQDAREALAGNPRPQRLLTVNYVGKGAICPAAKDGASVPCLKDSSQTNYDFDPLKTMPDEVTAAYQAVRRRCLR